MKTIEEFNEYLRQLKNHDWHYEYSDDGSVYRAGKASLNKIEAKAEEHTMYSELYRSYAGYVYAHKNASVLATHITIIKAKHIQPITQE